MKNGLPWQGYSFQRSKQPLRRRRLIYVKTFAGKAVVVVITGTPYLHEAGGRGIFQKKVASWESIVSLSTLLWPWPRGGGEEFINSPKVGRGPPNDAQEKVPKCGRAE